MSEKDLFSELGSIRADLDPNFKEEKKKKNKIDEKSAIKTKSSDINLFDDMVPLEQDFATEENVLVTSKKDDMSNTDIKTNIEDKNIVSNTQISEDETDDDLFGDLGDLDLED